MKTNTFTKLVGFAAAALISTATLAGSGVEKSTGPFDALDQDRDGKLTATEASKDAELSNRWTQIDRDESGTVDRVEFSAFEELIKKVDQKKAEGTAE